MENKTDQKVEQPNAQKIAAMSSAAKATWSDPVVAAKRAQRTRVWVIVDDKSVSETKKDCGQFKSVADAFKVLSLPIEKHAAFRLKLKNVENGVLNFNHEGAVYEFSIAA